MFNFLKATSDQFHAENAHWWTDPSTGKRIDRDKLTTLFLINSEIVEAGEAERKDLMDDHLSHRKGAEVELADALIRMFDYCGAHGYDLDVQLRRSFPSLRYSSFADLSRFFEQRFFMLNGAKPKQLMQMCITLGKIAELEEAGCPSRDIESQLAWLLMLICDYAGINNYDLDGAIMDKRAYNRTRKDHTNAARMAAGGKKW